MEPARTIKIVQLFESYPLFYQPYIPPVIKALQEKTNLDLDIVAFEGTPDASTNSQIISSDLKKRIKHKLLRYKYKKWPGLSYIAYKSMDEDVDILHLQHSYLIPKITKLLEVPIHQRPKVIVTLRGGDTYVKPWVRKKWRIFYKKYSAQIDAIITMSEHQKQYLKKWGVPMEKVHVIPISFGHRFETHPRQVNDQAIRILSVFRMQWEKNVDGNLRVIKALKERGLPVHYELYGDGPSSGQIHYLMDKYGITDQVDFKGNVENDVLKVQLQQNDFLLQLSLSEAFPTTVLEAQSFGLPCIVSDSGGLPESIVQGKSGYHVESDDIEGAADYIEQLWRDANSYHSFSKEAILHSQSNYAVENEVSRLQNLYESLV